jgi:hypothetical protein
VKKKIENLFSGIFIFVFLAGCAPQSIYHKKGMVLSSVQKDYDACKIKSFKEIPLNNIVTYSPGVHNPGSLSCYTIGSLTNCNRIGALDIPERISSRDENEEMRTRFINSCMNNKGYTYVELPVCGFDEEGYNALQKAPSLDKIKCLDIESPMLDY